jgi:hypothetical protein
MSREVQPLHEETRKLDPVYVPGKQGGQYMMRKDGERWVVAGQRWAGTPVEGFPPYARIGAWDKETAQQILDYCVEHDASMRAALQALYDEGTPDFLIHFIEKAKASKPRLRRGVVKVCVEVSFKESLDLDVVHSSVTNVIKNYLRTTPGIERVYDA